MQSDKATVEITSRYGGVVKILHHLEGSIVKVRGLSYVQMKQPLFKAPFEEKNCRDQCNQLNERR